MNVSPHTDPSTIKLQEVNEKLSPSPGNHSQDVTLDSSKSKTTQIALECLDRQQEWISEDIKKILLTLSQRTDRAELENKIKNLVQPLKTLTLNEEVQKNLNDLQLGLYKSEFKELSDAIRDIRPFMWNDLPKDIHSHILSQISFKELLKLHASKKFRGVVDLEIVKRINRNKMSLDFDTKTFAILLRALNNQGIHLRYIGFKKGYCSLQNLKDIIKCCPNLEEIEIQGSGLADQGFACICQSDTLTNLKILNFSFNQMTSAHALSQAPFKLRELYLGGNQITSFAHSLDNLQDLSILDLSENRLETQGLERIFSLSQHALTFLDLSHNQLTDERLPQIELIEPSQLKMLKLVGNFISDTGLKKIAPLISSLSGLYLDHNLPLDSEGLEVILKQKPKLTELGLSATRIGEEGVMKLLDFKNFRSVTKLNVGRIELSENFWTFFQEFSLKQNSKFYNLRELEITYLHKHKEKLSQLISFFKLKKIHCIFNPKLFFGSLRDIRDLGKPYGCEASLEVERDRSL